MTVNELKMLMGTTGYPVEYSHFNDFQSFPFICILVDSETVSGADLLKCVKQSNYRIELYTEKYDTIAIKKIEDILITQNVDFTNDGTVWISTESMFQTVFTFETIYEI